MIKGIKSLFYKQQRDSVNPSPNLTGIYPPDTNLPDKNTWQPVDNTKRRFNYSSNTLNDVVRVNNAARRTENSLNTEYAIKDNNASARYKYLSMITKDARVPEYQRESFNNADMGEPKLSVNTYSTKNNLGLHRNGIYQRSISPNYTHLLLEPDLFSGGNLPVFSDNLGTYSDEQDPFGRKPNPDNYKECIYAYNEYEPKNCFDVSCQSIYDVDPEQAECKKMQSVVDMSLYYTDNNKISQYIPLEFNSLVIDERHGFYDPNIYAPPGYNPGYNKVLRDAENVHTNNKTYRSDEYKINLAKKQLDNTMVKPIHSNGISLMEYSQRLKEKTKERQLVDNSNSRYTTKTYYNDISADRRQLSIDKYKPNRFDNIDEDISISADARMAIDKGYSLPLWNVQDFFDTRQNKNFTRKYNGLT